MLTMSTPFLIITYMKKLAASNGTDKTGKKGKTYHHGDLPRAMLTDAVRTIQRQGIDSLTLRGVGERLGVSRSALYRHFANKNALLQAVAAEGFRLLQAKLQHAWQGTGGGLSGFDTMGTAYIQFAVRHPAHYRVMFGSGPQSADAYGSTDAFGTLVSAIKALQRAGTMRSDDPRQLALYVWSVVHGVAMLALDGILRTPAEIKMLTQFAIERLTTGIRA